LISSWNTKEQFLRFTKYREDFEEFLIKNKDYVQQISRSLRGGIDAVHAIKEFFEFVLEQMESGRNEEEITSSLTASRFSFLKPQVPVIEEYGAEFSPPTKSQLNIVQHLQVAVKCEICGARVPHFGISFDHKTERASGGKGSPENALRSHHYCNSAKRLLLPMLKEMANEA
jgi:hypothetical protein